MAIQNDNTILSKGDLKAYHEAIAPMLGGTLLSRTNVSDHYSTDEKIVGVWTDGKPIYQKTVQPSSVQDGTVLISNDVDTYIYGEFIGYRSGEGHCVNYTVGGSQNLTFQTGMYGWCSDNKILLFNRGDIRATSIIATLRYTKTTDAAGSATTTPGAYDINFPNTWPENTEIYFGNGLYGQHLTGSLSMTSPSSTQRLSSIWGTNYQLVASGGTIKRGVNNTIVSINSSSSSRFYGLYLVTTDVSASLTTGVYLEARENGSMTNTYNIWITYTK